MRLSGWRNDGSLGKGEEGWRTTLGGRVVAQKGAGQGLVERAQGKGQGSLEATIGFIRHSQ